MSTRAFVMIETEVTRLRGVSEELSAVEGVERVDMVTGPYDAIAVVVGSDLNSIGNMVTSQIHSINGVVRTITCLAVG